MSGRILMLLFVVVSLSITLSSCGFGASTEEFGTDWNYQDMDGDGERNGIDADIDGDTIPNYLDYYPYDGTRWGIQS